ncbi:MAG: MCE family protein [Gammaproteobacteria bacterium]|nr:MAG: MCE family protein [Gammaproteobacteria bacterium]
MEERTSYLVVGVFVLAAAVVTVGFTVWIAGGRNADSMTNYTVMFDRDISGLTLGSPVRYLGVDVGEVVTIDLTTNQSTRVSVEVTVAAATPIHEGTYGSLAYQGITGVAFINLAADQGEFPPLAPETDGEYPVIPTRDVGLAALFAQSGDITAELGMLLSQANNLLGEDNQISLTRTLANVELLSDTLVGERELLAALPQRLVTTLDDLQDMMAQVRDLMDQAQPDLLAATEQLNQATANVAQLTDRVDRWFQANEESLDSFVAAGLGELPGLVADTRGALRELDKFLTDARADPSQFIYRPQRTAVQVAP